MSDQDTVEAVIPCNKGGSKHGLPNGQYICVGEVDEDGNRWEGYEGHSGARVVTLTQETDTLTIHTRAEPLHYDVEKKTRWVSEWEGVQE